MSDFFLPTFALLNRLVLYLYALYYLLFFSPFKVCKYYLQGACYYGSKCRYDHVKPRSVKITF